MPKRYCPSQGDIIWLTFDPQAGHEQTGRRPALVISPEPYNRKVGLTLVCPITNSKKGYPFEVEIPKRLKVTGVVLADQLKSMDWEARDADYCCTPPKDVLLNVIGKAQTLLCV